MHNGNQGNSPQEATSGKLGKEIRFSTGGSGAGNNGQKPGKTDPEAKEIQLQ